MPAAQVVDTLRAAAVATEIRSRSGLTQREIASLAMTSGPTIAAYERGRKEPRLSTLDRIARVVGFRIETRVVPLDVGEQQRARRERRSIAVAGAVAAAVVQDFDRAKAIACRNVALMERTATSRRARGLLRTWEELLDQGPQPVAATLIASGEHGHDMRQMNPFAGVLSDGERTAALAAADALERR